MTSRKLLSLLLFPIRQELGKLIIISQGVHVLRREVLHLTECCQLLGNVPGAGNLCRPPATSSSLQGTRELLVTAHVEDVLCLEELVSILHFIHSFVFILEQIRKSNISQQQAASSVGLIQSGEAFCSHP